MSSSGYACALLEAHLEESDGTYAGESDTALIVVSVNAGGTDKMLAALIAAGYVRVEPPFGTTALLAAATRTQVDTTAGLAVRTEAALGNGLLVNDTVMPSPPEGWWYAVGALDNTCLVAVAVGVELSSADLLGELSRAAREATVLMAPATVKR